jgi:hypothetical protein
VSHWGEERDQHFSSMPCSLTNVNKQYMREPRAGAIRLIPGVALSKTAIAAAATVFGRPIETKQNVRSLFWTILSTEACTQRRGQECRPSKFLLFTAVKPSSVHLTMHTPHTNKKDCQSSRRGTTGGHRHRAGAPSAPTPETHPSSSSADTTTAWTRMIGGARK